MIIIIIQDHAAYITDFIGGRSGGFGVRARIAKPSRQGKMQNC